MFAPTSYNKFSMIDVLAIATAGPAGVSYSNYDEVKFFTENDYALLIVESVGTLWYNFKRSNGRKDLFIALTTFYSMVTGKSVTGSMVRTLEALVAILSDFVPTRFQSDGDKDWIDVLDMMYSNVGRLKTSVLGNKIVKVFNHVIAHTFYVKMGLEIDPVLFAKIESKRIRPTVWNCVSFADSIVGLLLFLAKAGRHAIRTGDINAFFVDDAVVTKWLDEAARLRKNSEFLSNPDVLGTSVPKFIEEVKEAINTGKRLAMVFKDKQTHTIIHSIVLELECVEKRHISCMTAAKFRRAPIGVFLYGGAGVAKSFIATGLFNHYCSVRGIDKESAKLWTRDDNDEYYSGYKSHFAGVLYDDAAKFAPSKVQGVDPSIKDIISAINNIPFITNQAELCDKGKIPFLSEWVGVTSNKDDLNCSLFYNSSAAFLRRLPYRIEPIVKEEYCKVIDGKLSTQIDPSKIPPNEQYPDLWLFKVDRAVVSSDGLTASYQEYKRFSSYSKLLIFMTSVYETHIENQNKLMRTVKNIGPEELCECALPMSLCRCDRTTEDAVVIGNSSIAIIGELQSGGPTYSTSQCIALKKALREDVTTNVGTVWEDTQENNEKQMVFQTMWKDHLVSLRHTYNGLEGSERMFFLQQLSSCVYEKPKILQDLSPKQMCERLLKQFNSRMETYSDLRPRERLELLTSKNFVREVKDRAWLKTMPDKMRKCFFLEEQLGELMKQIRNFVFPLNDMEKLLLEDFVYSEAPSLIADGWGMKDLIGAFHDYLDAHRENVDLQLRSKAHELLTLDDNSKSWYLGAWMWAGKQYFKHKPVRVVCDTVALFPPVRWFTNAVLAPKELKTINTVVNAGKAYDRALGGDHEWIKRVILAATAVGFIVVVYKVFQKFTTPRLQPDVVCQKTADTIVCSEASVSFADTVIVTDLPLEDSAKFVLKTAADKEVLWASETRHSDVGYSEAKPQADVDKTGRLPTVRGEEKKNVWKQEQRNITKLDVDARRPNTVPELISGLQNNLCFAIVDGRTTTRVLIVDNNTVVANSHAVPDVCSIEVWLGPYAKEGLKPSYVIEVSTQMLRRHVDRDLVFINTWSNPRRFRDIRHYLPKRTFRARGPCKLVRKETDNSISTINCYRMDYATLSGVDGIETFSNIAVLSTPEVHTRDGDCGSALVCETPIGSVIAGIHFCLFAEQNVIAATPVYYEDFDHKPMVQLGPTKLETALKQAGKLYTDYHKEGHMMVHGGLEGFRARPKFTGRKTDHADYVLSRAHEFAPPIVDNMARPNPGSWEGAQQVLANFKDPTHSMSEPIVRACVAIMCKRFIDGLTKEDWDDIHPVPIDVAVNGYPGVPNVDSMQMSTSGGYGHRGPKLKYIDVGESETWDHYKRFKPETHKEIQEMRDRAALGIRPGSVFASSAKNEMLSKKKVAAKRVRFIFMCELALLTNLRMSTLGLTRVMIRRKHLFCLAVGLNTHSEEWQALIDESDDKHGQNWIAGDFKAFESVLSLLISNAVSKIFLCLAEKSGNYNEEEMLIFETLLAEISNATVDFDGTLITLMGGEVSGHQLTTFFNCMANVLLHLYAYIRVNIGLERDVTFEHALAAGQDFFDDVFIMTLGDDVFLKVRDGVTWYNHTSIMLAFSDIGITYTMADKDSESRPYISLDEVTFLKRSFVTHDELPGYVAALDKNSIYKMLLYTIPSNQVSYEEQMASALCSAQAEAFFHGRQFFDQIWELIEGIPKSKELHLHMLAMPRPTWNVMMQRYLAASPKLSLAFARADELTAVESCNPKHSYCNLTGAELQTGLSVGAMGVTTMGRSPEDHDCGAIRLSRKQIPKVARFEDPALLENNFLSKNSQLNTTETLTASSWEMAPVAVMTAINALHNKERRKRRKLKWKGCLQAGFETDTITPSSRETEGDVEHEQQVAFANESDVEKQIVGSTKASLAQQMSMPQELGSYFSRPIKISSYSWPENSADGFKHQFNPFSAFFNDANMKAKLKGFTLMRCTLKIKYMVNGSPFYYGSMLASFTPLDGVRVDTADKVSNTANIIANSQKPHLWITPQDMSTSEMTLPFVYPYPFVDTGFAANLDKLGKVQFWQVAPLLSANGTSSTNVDVTVYAWAEDVVLSGASDRPVMQSEYLPSTQMKTKPSAKTSLSQHPILDKAARATSSVASALGDVASLFGFTNAPNVRDVEPVKQKIFNLASTEISEPIEKLSLQPKQEIAVGGSELGGSSDDELLMDKFIGRPSLLTWVDWNTTDVPGTTRFSAAVSPKMYYIESTFAVQHTPMSYIANLFQYWRGDIRFTFKVVRSPYHRGRLGLTWDRAAAALSDGATPGNPNTYTTIMDLDEQSEVSMVVPYQQAQQFMYCNSSLFPTSTLWSTSSSPPATSTQHTNGVLRLSVVNRLTAPEPSSSCRILVFVNAEPGFQFAAPKELSNFESSAFYSLNDLSTGAVQSGDLGTEPCLAPEVNNSDVYDQVFGEKIVSLREVLHRSSLAISYSRSTIDGARKNVVRFPFKHIPPTSGNCVNGTVSCTVAGTAGVGMNFSKLHMINYICACYAGYKGSVNVSVNTEHSSSGALPTYIGIYRIQDARSLTSADRLPGIGSYGASTDSIPTRANDVNRFTADGRVGLALTNAVTNVGASANLPYYVNAGFLVHNAATNYGTGVAVGGDDDDWWRVDVHIDQPAALNDVTLSLYYGTGPDFDVLFFVNVPPIWKRSFAIP